MKLLFTIPLLSRVIKRKILSELGLDQTRVAMTGAAPLAPHIIAWYRQLGLELLEVFGMTENCATSHICTPGDMKVGYVGKPVPGVECRSEEHTSELQSLMRNSYAVFCLNKKHNTHSYHT